LPSSEKDNHQARLGRLTRDFVSMAELVERNVDTAVMALVENSPRFAYEVIALDTDIDEMEIVIDRQCLNLLAAAGLGEADFRFVAAAMKINNDLERISNQAVKITEHVLKMGAPGNPEAMVPDMGDLLESIEDMVRESVEALITRNSELAWKIWERHEAVEVSIRRILGEVAAGARKSPRHAAGALHVARATVYIGHVADYAKDIAEEVIYMREGIIVKHHEREFRRRAKGGRRAAPAAERN
jgi:phosphate transport system protein